MKNLINKYDATMQTLARLHLTTHEKDYKMEGFQSLSTSVLDNPICRIRRMESGSICEKCYADHLCRYRKSLQNCLSRNFSILTDHLFTEREALRCQFDTRYARIESFGDVASIDHARNYIRIIYANPETGFGIWSKNAGFWKVAFELDGKPDNCTFVLSSRKINEIDSIPDGMEKYVDHIFTVWDNDHYIFAGTPSECAGIKCRECLKCYRRNGQLEINEKLR